VPANPTGLHRGLPSRHLTLVLELRAPLRVSGLGSTVTSHAVAGGLHLGPALIGASDPQEGVQYALSPFGARALLAVSAAGLSGLAVHLVDLVGPRGGDLIERVLAARDWPERFRLLDAFLLHRLSTVSVAVAPEVRHAWGLIVASGGRRPVSAIAHEVGWSRRHLSARFREATGVCPKQAGRIARFEAARALLLDAERPPLADVAARCGFADQPHLAREWLGFAGCSVGTWLREELPFLQARPASHGAGSPHE